MSDSLPISKEAFLKPGLPEETVTIDNLGTVRIRSLSRAEFLKHRMADGTGWEVGIIAAGLVEPALSEDEVRVWLDGCMPKVSDDLGAAILRLSGLRKALDEIGQAHANPAVEDAKRNFRDEPGTGV